MSLSDPYRNPRRKLQKIASSVITQSANASWRETTYSKGYDAHWSKRAPNRNGLMDMSFESKKQMSTSISNDLPHKNYSDFDADHLAPLFQVLIYFHTSLVIGE
jgi:hypothetical protein